MHILTCLLGISATALLLWYVRILIKGEES